MSSPPRDALPTLRALLAVLASVLLHGAFFSGIAVYGALPTLDVEVVMPIDLRLGADEAQEVEALVNDRAVVPAAPTRTAAADGEGEGRDAGVPDAGRRRDAGVDAGDLGDASADAQAIDAGPDAEPNDAAQDGGDGAVDAGASTGFVSARATEGRLRLPPGGALALRFDFARIRETPLAPSVSRILSENPDFQKVIGGSGIDPVRDLDQFVMASPVIDRREHYLFVARVAHGPDWIRERVDTMATAHGGTAEWTTVSGFPAAPWLDQDHVDGITHRKVLLLDERHIVVAREEDVPDVLAWLASVARANPDTSGHGNVVGLGRDELLSLQIDGARRYLVGENLARFPTAARLSIVRDGEGLGLRFRGDYPNAEETQNGLGYFADQRDRVATGLRGNLFTRGWASMLEAIELEADDDQLRATTDFPPDTARLLVDALGENISGMYRAVGEAGRAERNGRQP